MIPRRHAIHLCQGLGLAAVMTILPLHDATAQTKAKIEFVPQIPHASAVNSVAFSLDGARVLSGGDDKTVKLWDTGTGRLIRTFAGHTKGVNSVAFSPDGTRVLSGSDDGTIKLWDTGTGRLIRNLAQHARRVRKVKSIAFSRDGARILSGSWNVKLWDAHTGRLIRTFEGHKKVVRSVAFSNDGSLVLSASRDNTVKLWDADTGQLIHTFEGNANGRIKGLTSVAISPDGTQVVAGSGNKAVILWDVATGRLVRIFEGHEYAVNAVGFLPPNGAQVLSGSMDNTLKLWDINTGQVVRTFQGHLNSVTAVAFSPDGARVLSGSDDKTMKLWDARTGRLIRTFEGRTAVVLSVAYSEKGNRVLSGGRDNTAKLWDADTGRLIRTFAAHSTTVFRDITSVAFSPDGAYVLAGGQDRKLKLWGANTGRLIRTFEGHADWVTSVAFSPDGARVFSGSKDRTVKLWDAGTGRLIHTSERHSDEYMGTTSIAISPAGAQVISGDDPIVKLWDISLDGTRVLSGGGDNMVKLWDVGTGRQIRTFNGHANWVSSVAFSPDGTRVLSGSGDETLKLWDASTGQLIRTFKGHVGTVNSVAFSPPGGARLISGGNDETVKLWEAGTGRLIRTFKGHTASVHSVAYSTSGARVLSGSADTTIRIWDTSTGQELVRMIASPQGEWLAMTPEGYFASSPDANDLLSVVRGLEVTSIEQVHQSLYDPDLVREKLAGDPDKEFAKAVKVMNLEKVLDSGQVPNIEVLAPKDGAISDADIIDVEATITDTGGGIGRIEWRVNGVTAGVQTPQKGSGQTITVKRQLALDPGENAIEVIAYNGRNLLASLPQRTTIKWQGAAEAGKGRLFVLTIGIDAYSDSTFRRLKLAVKDATDFSAAIDAAGKGEYASVHVVTALDGDATPAKLDQFIDRMARDITPRDTFILFAAAHGTSKDGRFYLIPYGYDSETPGALKDKAIGQDQIQDWLGNRIRARKALILLDTCESGALVGGHTRSRVDVPASEAGVGRLHEATGRPVLTAAASGKAALEGYKKENGLFTWAVLDALRNGDTGGNGIIELSELAAHVQSLVPKLTDEMRRHGTSEVGKRAAFTVPVPEAAAPYSTFRQSARFGSRGENFSVVRRLQ